jgi:hypothetical protein
MTGRTTVLIERRKTPRQKFNRMARVVLDGATRTCLVVDLSELGARLCCEFDIPDRFLLVVLMEEGSVQYECCVIWRLGTELSVQFTS